MIQSRIHPRWMHTYPFTVCSAVGLSLVLWSNWEWLGQSSTPIRKSGVFIDVIFSLYSEAHSRLQHESIIWQTQTSINQDRRKHTPIASVTPYSTSIHPLSYATSHNPSPESNKRPTNGHDYMTYSRRTASFMPIDPATDESTHLQATSSYLCAECPPSMI